MSQRKLIGFALIAGGVVLALFGLNATDAPSEQITEAFTGSYSDQTMMYLVGGAVAAVVGLAMAFGKK